MGSEQQFMVEGGGGHQTCGVTTGDDALGGQVEGVISVGRSAVTKGKKDWNDQEI
jgi:hypothetical protein